MLYKQVQVKDLKPGDEVDGKVVAQIRHFQFHETRAKEHKIAIRMINDEGYTVEEACEALGLVEGIDWRWCD